MEMESLNKLFQISTKYKTLLLWGVWVFFPSKSPFPPQETVIFLSKLTELKPPFFLFFFSFSAQTFPIQTLFFWPAKRMTDHFKSSRLHKAKPTGSEDCSLGLRGRWGSRGFAGFAGSFPRMLGYSQSFRVAESGSGVARLRVLDTLALALSRLLPRCSRRMCRTTAVALNACWRKIVRGK